VVKSFVDQTFIPSHSRILGMYRFFYEDEDLLALNKRADCSLLRIATIRIDRI